VLSQSDIIDEIADAVMKIQRGNHDGSLLASLEAQYEDVIRAIKNLLKLAEQGTITTSTSERLKELEDSREDLSGRIVVEKLLKTEITKEHVLDWFGQLKDMDIGEEECQQKIIGTFVHSVFLFDDKIIITGNYIDDKGNRRSITLDDIGLDEGLDNRDNKGNFKFVGSSGFGYSLVTSILYKSFPSVRNWVMRFNLTVAVIKSENWYVARCLENSVASQGKSMDEALSN